MDKYTVSKELAERMQRLGFKQFGILNCWSQVMTKADGFGNNQWEYRIVKNDFQASNEFISAPIAEEILGELPYFLKDKGVVTNNLTIIKNENQYMAGYGYYNSEVAEEVFYELEISEISLAEALGELWCLLKEKQLI